MYTVQVQKTGDCRLTPFFARPDAMRGYSERPERIFLEVEDEPLTDFSFSPQFTTGRRSWTNYEPLPAKTVCLAGGTQVLRVRFDAAPFNFGGLEFSPASDDAPAK